MRSMLRNGTTVDAFRLRVAPAHLTLSDLLEGVVLHAFEVYDLDLTAADSHLLVEKKGRR